MKRILALDTSTWWGSVALIERINPRVPAIALGYEADVVPLTPLGAATERHIVSAYVAKAADVPAVNERLDSKPNVRRRENPPFFAGQDRP